MGGGNSQDWRCCSENQECCGGKCCEKHDSCIAGFCRQTCEGEKAKISERNAGYEEYGPVDIEYGVYRYDYCDLNEPDYMPCAGTSNPCDMYYCNIKYWEGLLCFRLRQR